MSDPDVDVVEFMLTTQLFNDRRDLDPDDLPPAYRAPFWSDATIERPLTADQGAIAEATDVERPWEAISSLMFTDRDEFAGTVEFTDRDMAEEWFRKRVDADHVNENPVLAAEWEDQIDGVDYELAREQNRPARADRAFIDALLDDAFGNDGEDEEDGDNMLDLVDIRAPEEVQMTMDQLVLTPDQEGEIEKIVKAIEHRDYLARIGLREIGKLLFVGPPGTGKTSVARALAHDLQLPFVEVKLSMITSQYLGETAKNVEKTFEVAKRLAPCILFMDEFDFVAKTRSSDEHAAIKRAVNTLLKSIDEVSLIEDEVLLIGATNHPDQLDAAVWRRFDEIVNFPKPDYGMRSDILRVVTQQMDIDEFDPDELADITEGLTGSDLRLVLREAVLEALTEERTTLTQQDLREAVTDFEERDNLKNLDMIEGDHDALVAGGDISGAGDSDAEAASDGGHDHDHDHADHDHDHDHDHSDDD
ncbi:ATPase family associated with various cellular activities (AAA) [Halomicrobium zhouii]|uniref:ATPase family associated with various cellular activities (AAA) n=1 Tax=Halomicrobium zhouii TaxID=767519 RepID=A0A1I6M715_9EURY|nr:ATP-binding protein [Halomicrobium zhouii]SFS11484.1 ATPase family associated with various cellular activities (AAA) [Halomicrobium zhouii]